jgi:hypothetical protein
VKSADGEIIAGKWHSIVIVGSRQTLESRIYIDGTDTTSEQQPFYSFSANASDRPLNIGRTNHSSPIDTLDGQISSFAIWDRSVSPSEVQELTADPLAPFRQRKSVPYALTLEEETPDSVITRLGLTATPFKSYTITDKGVVVEDANGRHFLMFVF